MNSLLQFVCLILLVQNNKASPARGYNYFDFLYDDFEDNSIGSDSIDVSSLGPEAYGLPNTESGKLLISLWGLWIMTAWYLRGISKV